MVEYEPPQPCMNEGHRPNTQHAVLELYRLLAIFLASKNFASIRTDYSGEEFDPINYIQSVESDEITRLLLNLSITARVIDDREGNFLAGLGTNCGKLEKVSAIKSSEILTLRDACNKIIHAGKIRFDSAQQDGQRYLNPIVYLYGELHGKEWKATIDLIEFVKQYYSLICHL